jgi:hypothetical protein
LRPFDPVEPNRATAGQSDRRPVVVRFVGVETARHFHHLPVSGDHDPFFLQNSERRFDGPGMMMQDRIRRRKASEMASVRTGSTATLFESVFVDGSAVGMTNEQSLERFVARRNAAGEHAFEALVQRHGPMVLSVCRNAL